MVINFDEGKFFIQLYQRLNHVLLCFFALGFICAHIAFQIPPSEHLLEIFRSRNSRLNLSTVQSGKSARPANLVTKAR